MEKALVITLIAEVSVVVLCQILQSVYFQNLRHHHRENWEHIARKAPRNWRYFKGMPRTGFLVLDVIGDRVYRGNETRGFFLVGLTIVILNFLHVALLLAMLGLGVMLLF